LSKGSAYVTFEKSTDMNQAMLYLDGAQLDGNIIKATFVLVSSKRRREPSQGIHRITPELIIRTSQLLFAVFRLYLIKLPASKLMLS
jgi:RNA recognition motif-containing protein